MGIPNFFGGSQPKQPQQQQQQQPNWGGLTGFLNNEDRRNTPFSIGMIKDAAGGFGQGMQGAMGQIGAALSGNAERAGQNRDRLMGFTNSIGAMPFDMDPRGVQNWQADNARLQNSNFDRQMKQMDAIAAKQREHAAAAYPQQQQQQNGMMDMLRSLFDMMPGMGGSGGSFNGAGGGGGMPTNFNTNFGASGSFGDARGMGSPFAVPQQRSSFANGGVI